MSDFEDAKKRYEELREIEREKLRDRLADMLKEVGLDVKGKKSERAGKGISDYGSARLLKPFDLRNWKWVEVKDNADNFHAMISLNMLDIDPNSKNIHSLYDRIGIKFYLTTPKEKTRETPWIDTGCELPLGEDDIKVIAAAVIYAYRSFTDQEISEKIIGCLPEKLRQNSDNALNTRNYKVSELVYFDDKK